MHEISKGRKPMEDPMIKDAMVRVAGSMAEDGRIKGQDDQFATCNPTPANQESNLKPESSTENSSSQYFFDPNIPSRYAHLRLDKLWYCVGQKQTFEQLKTQGSCGFIELKVMISARWKIIGETDPHVKRYCQKLSDLDLDLENKILLKMAEMEEMDVMIEAMEAAQMKQDRKTTIVEEVNIVRNNQLAKAEGGETDVGQKEKSNKKERVKAAVQEERLPTPEVQQPKPQDTNFGDRSSLIDLVGLCGDAAAPGGEACPPPLSLIPGAGDLSVMPHPSFASNSRSVNEARGMLWQQTMSTSGQHDNTNPLPPLSINSLASHETHVDNTEGKRDESPDAKHIDTNRHYFARFAQSKLKVPALPCEIQPPLPKGKRYTEGEVNERTAIHNNKTVVTKDIDSSNYAPKEKALNCRFPKRNEFYSKFMTEMLSEKIEVGSGKWIERVKAIAEFEQVPRESTIYNRSGYDIEMIQAQLAEIRTMKEKAKLAVREAQLAEAQLTVRGAQLAEALEYARMAELAEARSAVATSYIQQKSGERAEAKARHHIQMEIQGGMLGRSVHPDRHVSGVTSSFGGSVPRIPQYVAAGSGSGVGGPCGPSDFLSPYNCNPALMGQYNFAPGGSAGAVDLPSPIGRQFLGQFGAGVPQGMPRGMMPEARGGMMPPPSTVGATAQEQQVDIEGGGVLSLLEREIKEKRRQNFMG